MKYFLVVQASVKDSEAGFEGPFKSIIEAKDFAHNEYDFELGEIFTVLVQDGLKFRQIAQAVIPDCSLPWK